MIKRALLIGPMVKLTERHRLREATKENALVIAVDGGVDRCHALKLRPDLAVGDWDGVRSRKSLEGIERIDLPREKNESDFYHALRTAIRRGAQEIVAFGLSGGRPDQELAVWFEAAQAVKAHERIRELRLFSENAEFHFVSKNMEGGLRLGRNRTVSVFSILGTAAGVSLAGFRYPLKDANLRPSSLGLSNVTSRDLVRISVRSGVLLVVALK